MSFDPREIKGLFFDIYATVIDWEAGSYPQLLHLVGAPDTPQTKHKLLDAYHNHQVAIWSDQPELLYPQVLEQTYAKIAQDWDVSYTPEDQANFGRSIGDWPAYPDSVRALSVLAKYFKLFVLSNVDNASFERTRTGPLQNAHWDGIYTAEMIGSYKPDPANYHYVAKRAANDFGIEKDELVLVAQNLNIDHMMSKKLGFKPGVWIDRQGSTMRGEREKLEREGVIQLGAVYQTLDEFGSAVEKAMSKPDLS